MNNYIDSLRAQVLKQLADLNEKIETNEPFPESKQSVSDLSEIQDIIEQCLNKWYY
jgi:flagellar hook-associated protein FlgK